MAPGRKKKKSKVKSHTLNQLSKQRSIYECFNQREQSHIQKALQIIKCREETKLNDRVDTKDIAREQVNKNKNMFFLGYSKRIILQKKVRLKTSQANSWNKLYLFQKKMNDQNESMKNNFNGKKFEMDQSIFDCNSKVDQKNKVIADIRKKGNQQILFL